MSDAYKQYRKEYRAEWYQQNKARQNFLYWLRHNPELKSMNQDELFERYKELGGAKLKRELISELLNDKHS